MSAKIELSKGLKQQLTILAGNILPFYAFPHSLSLKLFSMVLVATLHCEPGEQPMFGLV